MDTLGRRIAKVDRMDLGCFKLICSRTLANSRTAPFTATAPPAGLVMAPTSANLTVVFQTDVEGASILIGAPLLDTL